MGRRRRVDSDRPLGPQRGDRRRVQTELAQDGVGVLAQRRHRIHARVAVIPGARRQQRRYRAGRRAPPRASGPRAASCSCCHRPAMSRSSALAICASSSRCSTCSQLSAANVSTISARSASRLALRCALSAKRASRASAGWRSTLSQKSDPLALVLQAQHHRLAVAGRERAVGIDRGVGGAGARRRRRRRRRRSTADSPSTRPALRASRRRCAGRGRRSVAASARPGCWCRRTCRRRCRRSTAPALPGCVGRAGDRDEARLALDQQVVGLLVAVGAGSEASSP